MDVFKNILGEPAVMRCDFSEEDTRKDIQLPPFLDIVREVTKEKEYMTGYIARKSYTMPQSDLEASQFLPTLKRQDSNTSINSA